MCGLFFQFAELGRRFLMFERQRFPARLIVYAVVAVVGFVDYHVDLLIVFRVDGTFGVHAFQNIGQRVNRVLASTGVCLVGAVDAGQSVHVFQALAEGRGFWHFHGGRGDEREEEHENGNSRNQYPTLVHSESADNKGNDTNDNERTDDEIARARLVGNLLPSGKIRRHF